MTREDLKDKVREDLGLTKQEASEIVEGVIDTVRNALGDGEEIIIRNLQSVQKEEEQEGIQKLGKNMISLQEGL